MITVTRIMSAMLLVLISAACQTLQDNPKQVTGTLIGGGLGALVGSQIGGGKGQLAAVALGTLGGAFLGSEIGGSLDRADRLHAERNAKKALEYSRTGTTSSWRNPDSGYSGTFTPTRTFRSAGGQDCREFHTTVTLGGREEDATGRACRQPDGTWRVVQ
ncbi:MAG: RT0821/Lpp0805 family surface protein [Rhodospirillales bacterium]